MLAGDTSKTMVYRIDYWWPSEGSARDMSIGGKVGTWIGQNAKVLDKKRATEVVQLVREQFPDLELIEARHAQLQSARYAK